MYAGRVACCPLVSTPTGETDGRADERQTIALRFPLEVSNVKMRPIFGHNAIVVTVSCVFLVEIYGVFVLL